jgi:hypothetical protein
MSEMAPMPAKKSGLQIKFEKAVRLEEDGELGDALKLFVEVAKDDDWFFTAYEHLVRICTQLKKRYRRNAAERERVVRLEQVLEANKLRLERLREPRPTLDHNLIFDEGPFYATDDDSSPRPTKAPPRQRRGSAPPARGRLPAALTPATRASAQRRSRTERAAAAAIVERVPHIDVLHDGPVHAGERFEIELYLDELSRRAGETGFNLVAPAGSDVEVNIITSSHFRLEGGATARFRVSERPSRIDVSRFTLTCLDPSEWSEGLSSVIAIFFVDSRPCGKVARTIDVVGIAKGETKDVEARLEIGINGLPPADLTITVLANRDYNDQKHFWCLVSTPHLPRYHHRVTCSWILNDSTQKVVEGFMGKFTAADTKKAQLISELSGAGMLLFNAAPQLFQQVFWELVDRRLPLATIAIVSEEPFIPWELMIPNRLVNGLYQRNDNPIGVDYDIGRWTDERIIAPARQIVLTDSHVVAPVYDGELALDQSAAEAAMVFAQYPGDPITPTDFEGLEAALGGVERSLVHFVCHGKDETSGLQAIYLEGGDELSSASILSMKGVANIFARKRPVVFLNACEVGRGAPALVGLGGFVSSFIRLGATAVIAPLWSVDDGTAHAIAEEFYRAVKERPGTPFSRIFREIRAKAYDRKIAEDTYAAYCFYGDPYAAAD